MLKETHFIPLCIKQNNKNYNGKKGGILTAILSKNGKRLMLSPYLAEVLKLDGTVQIGFEDKSILLGKHLSDKCSDFKLKMVGKKKVLYSANAVETIASRLELDFTQGCSYTFYDVKLEEDGEYTIARFSKEADDYAV